MILRTPAEVYDLLHKLNQTPDEEVTDDLVLENIMVLYPLDISLGTLDILSRVVKPGGKITITVPNFRQQSVQVVNGPFGNVFDLVRQMYHIGTDMVQCCFTPEMLHHIANNETLGLEELDFLSNPKELTIVCQKK